jgi:hypothetical protein
MRWVPGKIHAYNNACTGVFGYSLIDVIGRSVSTILPAECVRFVLLGSSFFAFPHLTMS